MLQLDPTESDLVRRVAIGDEQAFKQLFLAYKDKLYSFSLRYTRSALLAEELVQEAFMKVWQNREKLDGGQCFGAYLFRITRNQLLNHLKRTACEASCKKSIALSADRSSNPTDHFILNQEYEKITRQAMEHLPPQRQEIFRMSRQEGLSHEEIAQTLNISPHTVKGQMHKALKTIRHYFEVYTDLTLLLLLFSGA